MTRRDPDLGGIGRAQPTSRDVWQQADVDVLHEQATRRMLRRTAVLVAVAVLLAVAAVLGWWS